MNKLYYKSNTLYESSLIATNYSFIVDSFILVKLPKVFNDVQFRLAKVVELKSTKISDIEVATIAILDSDYPELTINTYTVNDSVEFIHVDKSILDIKIVELLNVTNAEELEVKRLSLVNDRKALLV